MRETERQKRWAAGSITAYLCLVLILMLSLISGTIASVRNAHARVMTACAMEQGLYSLFAGYDRTLLGQYELFFYNGGDKSGVWKPETMSRKVAETAGEVLSPTASGMGILSGSLSGGQVTEVYLGGYRLATDEEGSAFSRQICEAMKASLGTYGIQQLSQKLRGEQETVKRQEDGQSGYEEEEVLKQYEESKQPEEGTEKTEGEGESGNGTPSEPDQKQPVPEDFVNPIEVIQKVMKMGILGLVLPEGQALSQGETDVSFLASKRELQSGFGMAECGKELSFVDKMISSEYILWKFPCYTSKEKKEGLQCQVEYVLCGKNSDQDNLAGTVNRLLALREAANLVYLAKDAQKQGEMEAMAGVIAASFGVPSRKACNKAPSPPVPEDSPIRKSVTFEESLRRLTCTNSSIIATRSAFSLFSARKTTISSSPVPVLFIRANCRTSYPSVLRFISASYPKRSRALPSYSASSRNSWKFSLSAARLP